MDIIEILTILATKDELMKKSKNGIYPFSKAKEHMNENAVFYDDNQPDASNMTFYDDKKPYALDDNATRYPIVSDYLIDELHHDVVSIYGMNGCDCKMAANVITYDVDVGKKTETITEIEMIVISRNNKTAILYTIANGECDAEYIM